MKYLFIVLLLFPSLCFANDYEILDWGALISDDYSIYLGSDEDFKLSYDETTDDRLELSDGTNLFLSVTDDGTTATFSILGALTLSGAFSPASISSTGAVSAGTLTTGSGSITDSSGAISFGNENLSTTGTLEAATLTESSNAVPNATDGLDFFAATTSAELLGVLSDETGTGAAVFANTPTLVTPVIGAATGESLDLSSIINAAGNLTLDGADPSIVFDGSTASDTDYWMGLMADEEGDDDDLFQIGKGTTPGTTPYVTVNKDGNVGIGTASPAYLLSVDEDLASGYIARFFNDGNNANRYGILVQGGADDASGTTYYFMCRDGNGDTVGYLANTSGTFALTDSSDVRLKKDIKDSDDGLAVIKAVKVREYTKGENKGITGFVAQELKEVFPKAVTEFPPDSIDEEGNPVYNTDDGTPLLGVTKSALIPPLVKAVQQLSVTMATLQARIDAQDTLIASLINRIEALEKGR